MSLFGKQLQEDIYAHGLNKVQTAKLCGVGETYIGKLCKGSEYNRDYIPNEEMLQKLARALPHANITLWRKLIELDRINKKCPLIAKELISCIDPETDREQLTLRDIKIITALIKQSTKE